MGISERATEFAKHLELCDRVAASTYRRVVLQARERGDSLVLERDGKVVRVPASEIVLPGEEEVNKQSANGEQRSTVEG